MLKMMTESLQSLGQVVYNYVPYFPNGKGLRIVTAEGVAFVVYNGRNNTFYGQEEFPNGIVVTRSILKKPKGNYVIYYVNCSQYKLSVNGKEITFKVIPQRASSFIQFALQQGVKRKALKSQMALIVENLLKLEPQLLCDIGKLNSRFYHTGLEFAL